MTRLLVTGAAGAVGSAVSSHFLRADPTCVLVDRNFSPSQSASSFVHCNFESPLDVERLINRYQPEIVLHLAGNKDVFALEKDPALAWRANVATTKNLLGALTGAKSLVIYISTDYVFQGTAGPYEETSPTRPTTEYGKSKAAAEACLLDSGLPVAIARSAALFGLTNDFVSVVRDCLAAGKSFPAFSDLVSNPTFVGDLTAMLTRLMDRRLTGVFHVCGSESLSREQFAKMIAGAFGLDAELIHAEKRTERVRPPDLSLSNAATCVALRYRPRPLLEILKSIRAQQTQRPYPDPRTIHGSNARD
ncbi:MAG TPA: SDR family oxidoreductase [Terriglobia bacterium]|nr:SDR family oxidoreductase [Terriglobia bacterium]